MKKLLSMLLVIMLSIGAFTVTASADNVILRMPIRCDLVLGADDNSYITPITDANGVITGRTIDATKASSTTLASVTDGTFKIRPIIENANGTVSKGGTTAQIKTNFVWQFDFSLSGAISSKTDVCRLQFSKQWNNKLYFMSLDGTRYYIRWSSTPDTYVNEANISTLTSKYVLEEGKTYRMKIEVNFDSDKVYVTFINPYVDAQGNVSETPNWNNAYTRTTTGKNASLGFSLPTVADVKNTDNRFPITLIDTAKGMTMTMSNETFYMDRLYQIAPTVSVSGNSITASTTTINIPDFGYYGYLPMLCCAVYNENELVAYNMSAPYASGLADLTSQNYEASVDTSELDDGEYTLKTFVWNDSEKIMPYPNCYAEKILTIENGVPTLSE